MKHPAKMIRFSLFLILCITVGTKVYAQLTPTGGQPKILGQLRIKEIPYESSGSPQEIFIHEEWNQGYFLTRDGKMAYDVPLRYNLVTNQLEIQTSGDIKVASLGHLRNFYWVDAVGAHRYYEQYINGNKYIYEGVPFQGLLQILLRGSCELLACPTTTVIKAHYIPQLDAGHREDTYHKRTDYYLSKDGQLFFIPRNIKKFLSLFTPFEEDIRTYMKKEDMIPDNKLTLLKIVGHYNHLIQQNP